MFRTWAAAGWVCPPLLHCHHNQGDFSSIALANSPLATMRDGWGQFYFHVPRVCSSTHTPSGPAPLSWPMSVSSIEDGKGWGERGHLLPTHTTTWRMSSRNNSTILTALELAHLSPLPTRTALLCYTCELQGLRYQVLQWVGVRESSLLLCPQGQLLHLPQALMVVEGQLSPTYIMACFSPACLFLNTQWPQINIQSHNIL